MIMKWWRIWTAVLIGTISGQSDTCPTFGTDQTSILRSTRERVFLNFEAPSQCRGYITSWNYCHYRSNTNRGIRYGAKLLVYRRSSATSINYEPVTGSVTELVVTNDDVTGEFRCGTIAPTQPFEIQENDIIAACVWDNGDTNPLYLVGDGASTDQLLYQYNRDGYQGCRADQLALVDTSHSRFILRGDFRLHLHANIDISNFCRVGNNPVATAPVVSSGTYLNTDHPVNCATENTITSWHYCYYTSGVTPGQTYTMTVGVWSLDTNTNVYRLTEGSDRTITLVPVATLAKVFCVEETLEVSNFVSVTQNDVIGVVLPNNNAIPVLSASTGLSLIRHNHMVNSSSLMASEFSTSSNTGLHLYSNLDLIVAEQETVMGTIGNRTEEGDNRFVAIENLFRSFYLNDNAPANASGTVSSMQYCYTLDTDRLDRIEIFLSTVGFYRPVGSNYTLVNSTVITVENSPNQFPPNITDVFQCLEVDVPEFEVEKGDVIGVCVRRYSGTSNAALRVERVNTVAESNGSSVLRSRGIENENFCTEMGVMPGTFASGQLRRVDDRAIRVSAQINCTQAGCMPANTTDSTTDPDLVTNNALGIIIGSVLAVIILIPTCTIPLVYYLKKHCGKKRKHAQNLVKVNSTNPQRHSLINTDEMRYEHLGYDRQSKFENINYHQVPQGTILCSTHFNDPPAHTSYIPDKDYTTESLRSLGYSDSHTYSTPNHADDDVTYLNVPSAMESSAGSVSYRNVPRATGSTVNVYELLEEYADPADDRVTPPFMQYEFAESAEEMQTHTGSSNNGSTNVAGIFFKLLEKNQNEDIYSGLDPYQTPANQENVLYHQLKDIGIKSIRRAALQCVGHLGSGQFGSVEQATWKWGRLKVNVALKSLNSQALSDLDRVKFLQEAVLMAQFKHPNIISLYGVVCLGEPVILVMELASKGDLFKILNSLRPDPGELVPAGLRDTLLVYSQQIALGMQYLSSKRYIHRDLAARNILVTSDNICKIADFGLSRDLANEDYYVSEGGKVPVKWTAPEALRYRKYSTASDVWSYGCVLYEIWSLGYKPFFDRTNYQVFLLVSSGKRLHSPPGCPKKIYKLMLTCWSEKAGERPIFREIVNTLTQDRIFYIPPHELETHPQAGVLGAELAAGKKLYRTLRSRYTSVSD